MIREYRKAAYKETYDLEEPTFLALEGTCSCLDGTKVGPNPGETWFPPPGIAVAFPFWSVLVLLNPGTGSALEMVGFPELEGAVGAPCLHVSSPEARSGSRGPAL